MVSAFLPGNHWYEESKFGRMILNSLILKTVSESIFYTSLVTISSIVLQRLRCTSILQPKILIWDIQSIEYIPSQVILRSILNFDDSSVYNLSKIFKHSSEVNKKDFQNYELYLTNNGSSYAFLVVYSLIVKRVKRYTV